MMRSGPSRLHATMRLAIVSDIHGNLPALDAVLADIARRGADLTVDCGDLLSGPLWPRETADRLIALGLPTIRGNHERQLLACAEAPGSAADQYAFEQTTPAQHDWLAALPATLEPVAGVRMVHGRPDSDLDYLLETVAPDAGAAGVRPARVDEVATRISGADVELLLCGHSHQPRVMQLPGGPLVVNPGSVGLQAYDDDHVALHWVRNGSPHARYALCESLGSRRWSIELIAVAYDWNHAAQRARANGAADWAGWLASGLA